MESRIIEDIGGVNTFIDPLVNKDGTVIHCVNFVSEPVGGKTKRPGYVTYLGTPDNSPVTSLFAWGQNSGTQTFVYRVSGTRIYSSLQGTGAWTVTENGTVASGAHVDYTILENTLLVGDGIGSTRHTTNGTSFTNTTAAPIAAFFAEYQGRAWAMGTASFAFYSTVGTATDWTSDSSSILIPGEGKLEKAFKASNNLIFTKNSRIINKYDGYSLNDMATRLGPSSPYSVADIEDFRFWINEKGAYITNAGKPQLISNAIERQFYNNENTGMSAGSFAVAPGGVYGYEYLLSAGTLTDDFTKIEQPNAIMGYNYQHDEWYNYQFNNFPTAYLSYRDVGGTIHNIFGDAAGQCYEYGGTAVSDNGSPIQTNIVMLIHGGDPFIEKEWKFLEIFTSPGCALKVQFMMAKSNRVFDPISRGSREWWIELGDLSKGYNILRFPPESRGKLCYLRFYESSSTTRSSLYAVKHHFDIVPTL